MLDFIKNSVLLLVSLLFCLLLAEGSTRLLQALELLPVFNKETLHKGFQQPEQTLNGKTVPSDNPILFHEYDPNDSLINSVGHRGAEFSVSKDPNSLRIALLGDSVAYGFGVPLEQTFAMRLQTSLSSDERPVEVYNFAVSGYGTEAHVELFKTKIKQYQPDLLLLAYVLNDPLPNNIVLEVVREIVRISRFYDKLAAKTQFGAWVYLQYYNWQDQQRTHRNYAATFALPETWDQLRAAVQYFDSEMDGRFAIGVFPLLLDWENYPFKTIHAQLVDLFAAEQIPSLDLLSVFSQRSHEQLRIHPQDNTHPNALGHSLAAEHLDAFLRRSGSLDDALP